MKRKKLSCIALLLLLFFAFGIVAESASVVAAPIIGRWQFDEGIGGITLDSSGKEKTGTISASSWVEGIMNKALKFTGAGSHVQVPSSNLMSLPRWSLTAFIMPTGTKALCVYSEKDSAGNPTLKIIITTDNRIRVEKANGALIGETARNVITRNEWNNIVVAYENGTVNCYVSGTTTQIEVRRVSLNKTNLRLPLGETTKLVATIFPANATNQNVTWSSSNPNVATVDASGTVTGRALGTATITVRTEEGGYTATCAVTVDIPVTRVSLNKTSTTLAAGKTETLIATVSPANATNKNVTWSSSNPSVATVSTTGVVTAKAAGTATITVRTVDGGYTANCTVTVYIAVTGVSLDKSSMRLVRHTHTAEMLTATVLPANANNKNVTWSSSNESVATVSNGRVTSGAAGTATITVKTVEGGKTANCTVTVRKCDCSDYGNCWPCQHNMHGNCRDGCWCLCNAAACSYGDHAGCHLGNCGRP